VCHHSLSPDAAGDGRRASGKSARRRVLRPCSDARAFAERPVRGHRVDNVRATPATRKYCDVVHNMRNSGAASFGIRVIRCISRTLAHRVATSARLPDSRIRPTHCADSAQA
jgi:hypothetical protein